MEKKLFIIIVVFLVYFLERNVPAFTVKPRIAAPSFENIRILLDSGGKGKKFQITYHSKHPLKVTVDNDPLFLVQDKKFSVSPPCQTTGNSSVFSSINQPILYAASDPF